MDKNKMENKGTGRVCLRALPFLMAFLGLFV